MRVLGVLVAWGVLAVLATMCFAVGGSIGYRRGVRDTLAQVRDRRTGKTGCRPLPANHLRRRTSGHARPGARARRVRWHVGPGAVRRPATGRAPARSGRVPTAAAASVAALLLIGIPGTAIGATTAQPGESLWKVKLGLEHVRLALATTPERDAEVHVDLASVRLTELAGLVADDDPAPAVVGDVAEDLEDHARAARKKLTDVQVPAVRTQLHRRLVDVTAQQVQVMDELLQTDCTRDSDDCLALAETRDSMVELQDESAGEPIALNNAAPVAVAAPAPSQPPSIVQAEPAPPTVDAPDPPAASAATPGDEADGTSPSAPTTSTAASAAPSPTPSPTPSTSASATPSAAPSPTPSTAPPPSGSPATEASVDPSVDDNAGLGERGSSADAATAADVKAE